MELMSFHQNMISIHEKSCKILAKISLILSAPQAYRETDPLCRGPASYWLLSY